MDITDRIDRCSTRSHACQPITAIPWVPLAPTGALVTVGPAYPSAVNESSTRLEGIDWSGAKLRRLGGNPAVAEIFIATEHAD
jgi:hypothetical protein